MEQSVHSDHRIPSRFGVVVGFFVDVVVAFVVTVVGLGVEVVGFRVVFVTTGAPSDLTVKRVKR